MDPDAEILAAEAGLQDDTEAPLSGDVGVGGAELGRDTSGFGGPVASADEIVLDLPQGVAEDNEVVGWFKNDVAVPLGLSAEQARGIANKYVELQMYEFQEAGRRFQNEMRGEWGGRYDANVQLCNRTIETLDRKLGAGGEFRQWVNTGIGNHPMFGRLMLLVGRAVGEDSLASAGRSSLGRQAMSTEEFLRTEVFKER